MSLCVPASVIVPVSVAVLELDVVELACVVVLSLPVVSPTAETESKPNTLDALLPLELPEDVTEPWPLFAV